MKRDRMIPLLLVLLMLIGAVATITQTPAQAITPAQTDPLPEKAYLPLVVRSRPTVKIATHFPLSGSLGREGISMRNAAELGLEQQAAALRERGFEVVLAVYDDAGSPELAQRNAAEIIADPTILCVNGHLTSDAALAALPLYARVDLPMVSPANTAPEVTDVFTNSFRLVGRDDIQGIVGLRFARSVLRASSAYIVHDTTTYGQGIAEVFRREAEQQQVGIAGFVGTDETADFDRFFDDIRKTNPGVVYYAGRAAAAGAFFGQARDPQRGAVGSMPFLGPDGLDSPELVRFAGDFGVGIYYSTIAPPISTLTNTVQMDFVNAYRMRFNNEDPRAFAVKSYDAVGVCIQAIAAAARTADTMPTRSQVLEAMRQLEPYQGVASVYQFNANGDPELAEYFVLITDNDDIWENNTLIFRGAFPPPTP